MNLTLLRVGFKGRIQASASLISMPWSLLQGTRPRDYREVGKGLGPVLVLLDHADGWRAPSPNTVTVGLRAGFLWFCMYLFVLLPERGGGCMCRPPECLHPWGSRVCRVCLILHPPGLG